MKFYMINTGDNIDCKQLDKIITEVIEGIKKQQKNLKV